MDDSFFSEKELRRTRRSSRGNVAIVVVLVLLIVGVGGAFFFIRYLEGKNSIKVLMSDGFDYLKANILSQDNVSGEASISFTSTGNSDYDYLFDILNNIDVNVKYGFDYKNKIADLDINTKYYKDKLINFNTYIENNTLYLYSGELYDKYVKVSNDNNTSNGSSYTKEDIEVVVSKVGEVSINALEDKYFTKSKEVVNGKRLSKTELLLNDDNIKSISKNILNSLASDTEFLSSYEKITGKNSSDIKSDIDKYMADMNSTTYDEVVISVYNDFTKFVMLKVKSGNNLLTVTKSDNVYNYKIEGDNFYSGSYAMEVKDNITYVYIIFKDDSTNYVGKLELTNKPIKNNIIKKNITDSVYISDISSEELDGILNKISNNTAMERLVSDISK